MEYHTYHDRQDAGRRLASALAQHMPMDRPLVLALPRGGVPVAAEIARALGAELDILVVRKLGHPLQPELAVGAIATGGIRVLNEDIAETVAADSIADVIAREEREVERRSRVYRSERGIPVLQDRNVILVDDGVATGATMLAAVRAVRAAHAHRIVVAVPVGDPGVCVNLGREADRVLCPLQPPALDSVGRWYDEFPQLTDEQVRAELAAAWSRQPRPDAVA